MKLPRHLTLILLFGLMNAAFAVEIATGKMLRPKYDTRSFYVREGRVAWRKTYTGPQYRLEVGRLVNLRVAQAVTHDEWLTEEPSDSDKNTSRVI